MRKIFLLLLLLLPVIGNAQRSLKPQKAIVTQKEPEKQATKFEDFISKPGVCTIVSYKVPEIVLTAAYGDGKYTDKISFVLEKYTISNLSVVFLSMHHSDYDKASTAIIEASEVKALFDAINEMTKKKQIPKPEGAAGIKHTFISKDGIFIEYSNDSWRIKLEKYSKDEIWITDIEPFNNRLQEVIQKIETIQ